MTGIPHEFFVRETPHSFDNVIPEEGHYAVGNVFLSTTDFAAQQATFEEIAKGLGLRTLGWRDVPSDNSILGPASRSKEPKIRQPFVVLESHYGSGKESQDGDFDAKYFERQLYVLRKSATHKIGLAKSFYICSLTPSNIIYKGQLSPVQVYNYFHDLNHALYSSHFALVHSRFSTNTFPSWDRAQPMRWAAHNGEINTVRGNKNWMKTREGHLKSALFGDELDLLYPIVEEGGSDSAAFDNVLELLTVNGVLTLPEAVMLMVPEAWQNNDLMEPEKKAFYNWAASLMEPWDGPALFTFSDGRYCGANLDRNGLRPCRYVVTNDDIMVCASEVGTISIEPERIIQKGRLKPGRMLLVDTKEGRIVDDKELKMNTARRQPFAAWVENQVIRLPEVVRRVARHQDIGVVLDDVPLSTDPKLLAFGFTIEQLNMLMLPMLQDGHEALGSMGNDAALACMSSAPRNVFDYFRQLFAQVTNPPIDPIRESIVMSLETMVGREGNLLEMKPDQLHRLHLKSPILTIQEMNAVKHFKQSHPDWPSVTIDMTFPKAEGLPGYRNALNRVRQECVNAVNAGIKVLVLSDRTIGPERLALSAALATGGVHHYLISQKKRSDVALMIETGEAREVHHACVLVGYGADAVCPWLIMEMIYKVVREGMYVYGLQGFADD
jgi:glutamate synthase (NADPH/NADH)